MQRFAALLDRLTYAPQRSAKLALMGSYLRATPDPDRGYGLAALTDGLLPGFPMRRLVGELATGRFDPELFRLARDYVGDTAETLSLMWPAAASGAAAPRLHEVVAALESAPRSEHAARLAQFLDRLDATGRWALLKAVGGAPRVGVSARLAKLALAEAFARPVAEIEEVWHGLVPPYTALFAWLEGRAAAPGAGGGPAFRPLMLANPITDDELAFVTPAEFAAEWKWDGIRVQLAAAGGQTRLYSRSGDDISAAFPDLCGEVRFAATLDGELLVMREGHVAPFADLQQRLNRKTPGKPLIARYPAHIRFYDLLVRDGADLRALPFEARRQALEEWFGSVHPARGDLSPLVPFTDVSALRRLWQAAREEGIEGLMLKRRASPYLQGRPRGHWFKWKRAALTADCVLMYAQRGSGKRSSYYSDFTFGAWDEADGGRRLVPVGKSYSGFSDAELLRLDRFVRQNTIERFGPVRSVTPALVFEVAFDSIQLSGRHKSGIAMRFPRIARIRWDKPAAEAETLEGLRRLVGSGQAAHPGDLPDR